MSIKTDAYERLASMNQIFDGCSEAIKGLVDYLGAVHTKFLQASIEQARSIANGRIIEQLHQQETVDATAFAQERDAAMVESTQATPSAQAVN